MIVFKINPLNLKLSGTPECIAAPADKLVDVNELVTIAKQCRLDKKIIENIQRFVKDAVNKNIPRSDEVFKSKNDQELLYDNMINALKHLTLYFTEIMKSGNRALIEDEVIFSLMEISEKASIKDCPIGRSECVSNLYFKFILHNPQIGNFKNALLSVLAQFKRDLIKDMISEMHIGRGESHTLKGILHKIGHRIGIQLTQLDTYADKQDDTKSIDTQVLFTIFIHDYYTPERIIKYLQYNFDKFLEKKFVAHLLSDYPAIIKFASDNCEEPTSPFYGNKKGVPNRQVLECLLYDMNIFTSAINIDTNNILLQRIKKSLNQSPEVKENNKPASIGIDNAMRRTVSLPDLMIATSFKSPPVSTVPIQQNKSLFEHYLLHKKVLIGAAIGFSFTLLLICVGALIFFTSGMAAIAIANTTAAIVAKTGMIGAIGIALGAAALPVIMGGLIGASAGQSKVIPIIEHITDTHATKKRAISPSLPSNNQNILSTKSSQRRLSLPTSIPSSTSMFGRPPAFTSEKAGSNINLSLPTRAS